MRRLLLLASSLVLFTSACREAVQPLDENAAVALTIQPSSAAGLWEDTLQLRAFVQTRAGIITQPSLVHWVSLDADIASVDSTGRVLLLEVGRAKVEARFGTLSAVAELTTAGLGCDRLIVNPAVATLRVGEWIRATSSGGGRVPGCRTRHIWSSSAPEIAAVSDSGDVIALSVGKTAVTASTRKGLGYGTLAVTVVP